MKKIKNVILKIIIVIVVLNLSYVFIHNIMTFINFNSTITLNYSLTEDYKQKLKKIDENVEKINNLSFEGYDQQKIKLIKENISKLRNNVNNSVTGEKKSKVDYYALVLGDDYDSDDLCFSFDSLAVAIRLSEIDDKFEILKNINSLYFLNSNILRSSISNELLFVYPNEKELNRLLKLRIDYTYDLTEKILEIGGNL